MAKQSSAIMLAFFLAVAFAVYAVPPVNPQDWGLRDTQLYTIRVNCTGEPWHGRYLVHLPRSNRLGLENFTVNPETPPLRFSSIRIRDDDNTYALRGADADDDLSRTPYLASFVNKATRTVSLKIVYLSNPLRESFETQTNTCPEGYDCTVDQWAFADHALTLGESHVYYNLRYEGFKGRWEPFKDSGKEGWHLYWKGNAGIQHPVQLDLVPVFQMDGRAD